jgi:hypothetical protein
MEIDSFDIDNIARLGVNRLLHDLNCGRRHSILLKIANSAHRHAKRGLR